MRRSPGLQSPILWIAVVTSGVTAPFGYAAPVAYALPLAHAFQEGAATPAEQFQALLREYETNPNGPVHNDEERLQGIGRGFRRHYEIAQKFVELAEAHPADPIAFDALEKALWHVNTTPWPAEIVGPEPAVAKAVEMLRRDHAGNEKIGPLCERISFGFRREYELLLRAVLERNEHRPVQALACLGLARFLEKRQQRVDAFRDDPHGAKEFEDLFGREYVQELLRQDPERAVQEADALLERAVASFADVPLPAWSSTVGEQASAALRELRLLRVGKVAPDIEGEDQDGTRFRLSDYRGKVVLLDFWHQQ